MEIINIEHTDETPAVVLDAGSGNFEFSGRSMPEDVTAFYGPILEWLDGYSKNPNPKTNIVVKLDYFNTASSKMLLDILLKLEEMHNAGNEVKISWYYKEDDEDMEEAGEEYEDMLDLPFEIQSY